MTEASVFYEATFPGLGSDFLDDVQRVVDTLREHPELGRALSQGLRQALLHRFPFSLIYAIETRRNPHCGGCASTPTAQLLEGQD